MFKFIRGELKGASISSKFIYVQDMVFLPTNIQHNTTLEII